MKSLKLLLIILVLCTSVTVFSQQEKYETYIDPYKGEEHPISIVKGKKGKFSLLINAVSFDSYNLTGGLRNYSNRILIYFANLRKDYIPEVENREVL